jgi:excisionase family DNA binding protein
MTERIAFSIKEVADQIGVHPATVKRSIARGHLQVAKILGRTLILRQDRDEWLTKRSVHTSVGTKPK